LKGGIYLLKKSIILCFLCSTITLPINTFANTTIIQNSTISQETSTQANISLSQQVNGISVETLSTEIPGFPSLSATVTPGSVLAGDTVNVSATVTEGTSSVSNVFAYVREYPYKGGIIEKLDLSRVEGTDNWTGEYKTNNYAKAGTYSVSFWALVDGTYYDLDYEKQFVVNNSDGDVQNPVLENVEIAPDKVLLGDSVKVSVSATDNVGVGSVSVFLKKPQSTLQQVINLTYNETENKWVGSHSFTKEEEVGEWGVEVEVTDLAMNRIYQTGQGKIEVSQPEVPQPEPGWADVDGKRYYYNNDGTKATGWLDYNGKRYYLSPENGEMKTGWYLENGSWYYLNTGGDMHTGWLQLGDKWYYLDAKGVMSTGWLQWNNSWYLLDNGGVMQTGWVQLGTNWFYFNTGGVMYTGWLQLGNSWYYLDTNGVMQTGWLQYGNSWYFLNNGGVMATGWLQLGNSWYYLDAGGVMKTGWVQIGGKWYYFYNSGVMAANTYIGSYRLGPNGEWIQ
jgi:glucan-binding YG repeat protein